MFIISQISEFEDNHHAWYVFAFSRFSNFVLLMLTFLFFFLLSIAKSKPEISYPTCFEHTVHVGFDAITGEFTVSTVYLRMVCSGPKVKEMHKVCYMFEFFAGSVCISGENGSFHLEWTSMDELKVSRLSIMLPNMLGSQKMVTHYWMSKSIILPPNAGTYTETFNRWFEKSSRSFSAVKHLAIFDNITGDLQSTLTFVR